jgi:hypothetical protein
VEQEGGPGQAPEAGPGRRASTGQRRRRLPQGRRNSVHVRLTDEEYAAVAAAAAQARLSVPAWLAVTAMAATRPARGRLSPAQVRSVLIELYAVRRGLSHTGRNINDVARLMLGTGQLKEGAGAAVAELRAATGRLERFLAQAQGHIPGVDLSRLW